MTVLDEDDVERLALLERAVELATVTVEVYPGYGTPRELHAYVCAPAVSGTPIFACVLGSPELVEPHCAMETATFQVIEGETLDDDALIIAAIKSWIHRLWPLLPLPKVILRRPWCSQVG